MSGGRMSGGRLSGGLKSYDRTRHGIFRYRPIIRGQEGQATPATV